MSSEIETLQQQINTLKAQKAAWYNQAEESGILAQIKNIARKLGKDPASPGYVSTYGPKYVWRHEGVKIYVDDYGQYATVHYNDKKVMCTHQCDRIYVPGEWEAIVLPFFSEAEKQAQMETIVHLRKVKQDLIRELGL